MERRREPRFQSGQQVETHILGREPAVVSGHVENISGRGMRLILDRTVPPDTAVMIKTETACLLAEVCYSEPVREGYAIGLKLDQVLFQTAELAALNRALLGRPATEEKSSPPPARSPLG